MTGSSSSSSESAGSKRKRADDDIDMESNPDLAQQMLDEIKRNYRFPRLLSSRRLLELEVNSRFPKPARSWSCAFGLNECC